MAATVTLKGNPLKLYGEQVTVGETAPNFHGLKGLLDTVSLASFRGKTVIINSVPSIDTPVCDLQAKRFNEEAAKLGPNVVVLVVSVDLPPAQARWCGVASAKDVVLVSDFRDHDFGRKYGTLIPDLGLLCRAVFVVDPAGVLKYAQYVSEIAEHPDYEAALAAAK